MRLTSILASIAGLVLVAAIVPLPHSQAHQLGSRWEVTATDGSGLLQGDPTIISWGFVDDGTPLFDGGNSDFIAFLDNVFDETDTSNDYTQRSWWQLFDASFHRWSQLAGLTYVYEPNDDGSIAGLTNFGTQLTPGFLGVRADVRIGGKFIDGPDSVLAFNYFPESSGEMVFDTADGANFGFELNNFVAFRNVIMHEHGHGLGIRHVESEEADFLMEPFLNTGFDGPQFDDILAAHRGYGDVHEKKNNGPGQAEGNEIFQHSISLGTVPDGGVVEIGTDARPDPVTGLPQIVEEENVDFISIDGITDVDYLSFDVPVTATVNIALSPQGPTYLESEQTGDPETQTPYDTTLFNNLSVQLFDTDGTTQLGSNNSQGIGEPELLSGIEVGAGTYYVRVEGEFDDVQFYDLVVSASYLSSPGDFNQDGAFDCADIDALVADIAAGTGDLTFDVTGDGVVDAADLDQWLTNAADANGLAGPYLDGDANLDGVVDTSDFNLWNTNKLTSTPAWCSGDFNADGFVDVSDFNIWNLNKFQTSGMVATVPEPSTGCLAFFAIAGVLARKRNLR